MIKLLSLLLCLLLLAGCAAPVQTNNSTPAVTPTLTWMAETSIPPADTVEEAINRLDPLGLVRAEVVHTLPAADVAACYGGEYDTYDNAFEVPDFSVGGRRARLILFADKEELTQITVTQIFDDVSVPKDVYDQIIQGLGNPDSMYELNRNSETGQIDEATLFFTGSTESYQIHWEKEGYNVYFGLESEALYEESFDIWYLAICRGRLDMTPTDWFMLPEEERNTVTMHPVIDFGSLLTVDCLEMPVLEILEQWKARPVYRGVALGEYAPQGYRIKGLTVYGQPAEIRFLGDPQIYWLSCSLDMGQLSWDDGEELYEGIYQDICQTPWSGEEQPNIYYTDPTQDDLGQTISAAQWWSEEPFRCLWANHVYRPAQWENQKFLPEEHVINLTWYNPAD